MALLDNPTFAEYFNKIYTDANKSYQTKVLAAFGTGEVITAPPTTRALNDEDGLRIAHKIVNTPELPKLSSNRNALFAATPATPAPSPAEPTPDPKNEFKP